MKQLRYSCSRSAVLLMLVLTPLSLAIAQNSSDNANQSWKATTQQQVDGNASAARESETHNTTARRTTDTRSVEHMGMDGKYEPYLDVQKETVKVDATTERTVERTFSRDADGRKTLVQVTQEEKRTLPGGEVKIERTTSDPDTNGGLQVVRRELENTRQLDPNVQETKTSVFTPDSNGGFAMSMQSQERQTKSADKSVAFHKTTSLPNSNGGWQVSEVREGTIKDDGSSRTKEESVLRPGTDGNLSVAERTVSKESANTAGDKRETVETYSTDVPGSVGDGNLHLNQRMTTVHRKGDDAGHSSEEVVERRNPGQPTEGLEVTRKTIDIVRPGLGGTTRETRTVQSLDGNGSLGIVSVDTRQQDGTPVIQVGIAPAKPDQKGPAQDKPSPK